MRVITSVGLALLLVLGLAMAHSDASPSASPASPVSAAAGDDAVPAPGGSLAAPVVASAADAGLLLGATACIFGILCGLALLAVRRRARPRPASVLLDRGERATPVLALVVGVRPTSLSLTQLSLSRT